MIVPTVEDRVEDIRRRAALLRYIFDLQQFQDGDGPDDLSDDAYMALKDYVKGIIAATHAIDAAECGMPNPKAPYPRKRAK